MKKKNIILLGAAFFNNNNRGCIALTLGALNLLSQNYPDLESITIINSAKKHSTDKTYIQINDKNIELIIEYCNKYDYYNFITDSIVYMLFNKTKNKFINLFSSSVKIFTINYGDGFTDIYGMKRLLIIFIETFLALVTRKKITLLPQTIGPFKTNLGKLLSKFVLKNSEQIFVRDKKANKYLKSIGVKYNESFDLSVYMPPEPVDIYIDPDTIGINISGLLHFKTDLKDPKGFENYDALIENLIKEMLKLNKRILLIPHTYNAKSPEYADDLSAIKELADKINSEYINIVDQDYTAPQLKYIISKCAFFIGSRMHSNFAALSTSTPVVGLGYSYKFQGGFEMFNIPECALSVKGLANNDIPKVINYILDLLEHKSEIKRKLEQINNSRESLVI